MPGLRGRRRRAATEMTPDGTLDRKMLLDYIERRWKITDIPYKTKGPKRTGW